MAKEYIIFNFYKFYIVHPLPKAIFKHFKCDAEKIALDSLDAEIMVHSCTCPPILYWANAVTI